MLSRCLAIGAVVWTAGYTGVYLAIVGGQGNPPAWWYVAVLGIGAGSLALAVAGLTPRPILILGVTCLTVAALAGALSIGMLLVPAVAAAAVVAAGPSRRRRSGRPAS